MSRRAALAALLFPAALAAQTADLVVTHASIYTVNAAQPKASSIAVKGARILYVGDDPAPFIGPATRQIDAHGAALVPGLIDSHGHLAALGDSLSTLDLRGMTSEAAIAAKVKDAAAQHKPGEWIRGSAWDQNLFPGQQFPTKASLTAAAPDNPVFLTRVDGHAAWVNQKALDLADVNAATPDPPGGKVLRNANGQPSGVLIDRAQGLVAGKIPEPDLAEVKRRIERAARECARLGLTTVHDAGVGEIELRAYRALIAEHRLPVRIYAMLGVSPGNTALWNQYQKKGPEIGEFLTVRSLKLYADGALGSRGAAMLAPYTDDPGNSGLIISGEEFIHKIALEALRSGFQVNTHAIGDRANHIVLNAYAAALQGPNDHRFRVEHAQIIAPEDFARFRDFSVIASMQPTHATSDMPWAEARVGPARIQGAYAWQTLMKLGVHVASGSDFPVENANPLWGFYSAVTRQDRGGNPPGGWYPDQRMTRAEALRSWTLEGAYAAFQEKEKGSLEPGKLADFILLSDDVMQVPAAKIAQSRVILTVLGGQVVYSSLADQVIEIPPSEWRQFDFVAKQLPVTVHCSFEVLTQPGAARAVLLSRHDLQQFARNQPYGFLRASEEQPKGELTAEIREPGDYAALLINSSVAVTPAQVRLVVAEHFAPPAPVPVATYLTPRRRLVTLLASILGFGMIVGWSGGMLLRAIRRVPKIQK